MIQYYINEEKKTVVAKLGGKEDINTTDILQNQFDMIGNNVSPIIKFMSDTDVTVLNTIEKQIRKATQNPQLAHEIAAVLAANINISELDEFVGKAKCHPDDEFDIEVGKVIAKSRCLKKFELAIADTLSKISYDFNKIATCLSETAAFHYNKAEKHNG